MPFVQIAYVAFERKLFKSKTDFAFKDFQNVETMDTLSALSQKSASC